MTDNKLNEILYNKHFLERVAMSIENQSPEDHEPAPVGTMVLLVLTALGMTVAWAFLYFGIFLPRGTVS